MKKYVCEICGWIYDPDEGVPEQDVEPGTRWADVPDDFTCPECGAGKSDFVLYEEEEEEEEEQ